MTTVPSPRRLPGLARFVIEPRLLLFLAIGVQLAVFVVARRDVPIDDAIAYAENAFQIGVDPETYFREPSNYPFVMRVGITLPLALIFELFGVSSWTTNLPCLLASIVIVLVVYAAAPTARAKRFGLGFATGSTAFVLFGPELNADMLCGAATAVSLLLLTRRDRAHGAAWIAGAVLCWFIAFLIKETTIWFAPAWLYAGSVDVRRDGWRQTGRRYAPAIALGIVLVAAYLVACAHVWGDTFARMTGINVIAGDHLWSSRDRSAFWWARRLLWGPPLTYVATFGTALLVAVVGARRIRGPDRVWVVAMASFLLIFWFGSASTSEYVPLPLAVRRMLMTVLPPILVNAALAASGIRWRRWLGALVIAATVMPLLVVYAGAIRRARPETAIGGAVHADVQAPGEVVVVCPDYRCLAAISFVLGFRVPANLKLVNAVDFVKSPPPPPGTRVRAVVNLRSRITTFGGPRIVAPIESLRLRPIYWHHNLRLYDAGDGARLREVLLPVLVP